MKEKKNISKILEPFALGVLALLFIIPTITVMNLKPLTKELKKLDVLGVTTENDIRVSLIGGTHEIINEENLSKVDDYFYSYSAKLGRRDSDSYSKPILKIVNRSEEIAQVTLFGQTLSNTKSNISLIINEKPYRLQDTKGEIYLQEIEIQPNEEQIIFLSLENFSGIQFSDLFELDIKIINNNPETNL